MIQNLTDLARECGSSINDPSRQRSDIAKAVLSHSDGLVRPWVYPDVGGLNLISKYSRISMRFPFDGDIFWKNVEWLQEEALTADEDGYEALAY